MFQLVKALFKPTARRSPRPSAMTARLTVEALEAREVPTTLSIRPVAPASSLSGILLPALNKPAYLPAVQVDAAILFPVFSQR